MKGKMTGIIILAIMTILFTVWCFVDGTYYLALFGLFIFGCQVYNYISIKRRN